MHKLKSGFGRHLKSEMEGAMQAAHMHSNDLSRQKSKDGKRKVMWREYSQMVGVVVALSYFG